MARRLVLLVLAPVLLLGAYSAAPAQAARTADAPPVVRVGTEGTYPPFTYVDPRTNQLTGYDIEVVKAVAKKTGWQLKFVQSQFDAIFAALDAKRIDVIANQITINPERQARYLFSTPYTYSHGVIVTAADNKDIHSLKDLRGKTTAQSATSNWYEVAKEAGAKVENVEQFAQAAALLDQGRVDAVVNDNIAVLDYLASTGSTKVKIAGNAGSDVGKQALTFRKTDTTLQQQADKALAQLRSDGTLKKISEKYFKADVSVEKSGTVSVKGSDTQRSRWEVLRHEAWPMLWGVIRGTIPLTAISFVVGLALGLAAALARLSRSRLLDLPARVYISVIRGTPLLVQLFVVFYGLPEVGVKLNSYVAACLALSLNVGGYAAETIRASILSVPRGQFEAATTIGMDYRQTMRRVVLPQAARIAVPPLSNELLSLIKDTSLASVVLVPELLREATVAASVSGQYLLLYAFAALYYWVICFLVSRAQPPLERRLGRYVA
ncbi:MAG: transporter substrate-binding protein [Marmoricola sp.]|nr:transporter substrate-binding protein [Marmoricola sp.]